MANTQPKSVFETILEWSSGRPVWQRDALRRIVTKGKLSQDDKAELVQLCLKGQGTDGIVLEAVPLTAAHIPAAATTGSAITLTSIAEVSGVNRLAVGQTLPFAPRGRVMLVSSSVPVARASSAICFRMPSIPLPQASHRRRLPIARGPPRPPRLPGSTTASSMRYYRR